jgi:glycine cleavage system H protein
MTTMPQTLRYTKSHEWVQIEDNGQVTVGITDHAQELLGDLVYVELPEVGSELQAGETCATVESVKAASDVYAPVSGRVTEINEALADAPEKVNESAFAEGWLFRMEVSDSAEFTTLLDAGSYQAMIASDA